MDIPTKVGERGVALIKDYEGCAKKRADGRFDAYPDPATGGDPWTIGWGSTGAGIERGTVWTQAQCDDRLAEHLADFSAKVAGALGGAATTQSQFDAMVSLAYNIGVGKLRSSTLLRKHCAGDHVGAADEFHKWNRANGKVMPGLVKRRAAEAVLYVS